MGSEAPELMAIKDANLRMQREMFRLGDERNSLADSVIVRQEEIERLDRLVERITLERDRAVDRYQLAEDRIDDLEGLIKAYRDARDGLGRYHMLPSLTDEELMDDVIREQRNADRDAAYDAVARCQDDLFRAVKD